MFGFKKKKKKQLFLWRSVLSKMLGLSLGVAGATYLWTLDPSVSPYLLAGLVLWFTFEGGLIALVGVITRHPLWKGWTISAWQRGLIIGLVMHVMLGLLIYDALDWAALIPAWVPDWDLLILMAIEGAILGMLWDSLVTKATGQGKELIKTL